MHFLTGALTILLLLSITPDRGDGERGVAGNSSPEEIVVAGFSQYDAEEGKLPEGWEEMTFRRLAETKYSLYNIDGKTVIRAESEKSSSGLVREKRIDLNEFPVMRWSWKTEQVLEAGDVYSKDGDDYPVRIYIIFDYSIRELSWRQRQQVRAARLFHGEVPARAMNYIWDTHSEVGTVVPNPYTDLVKMVVIESGDENVGKWMEYEVNVLEDYRDIYGEDPPQIAAIAIMTDTDDTESRAISYFGDISFHREKSQ